MTELLVGTKKGLFRLEGSPREQFAITGRWFAGEPVEFAMRDERTGRAFACVTSAFYGPKLFYSDDLSGEWQQATGVELPEGGDAKLERLWSVVPGEGDGLVRHIEGSWSNVVGLPLPHVVARLRTLGLTPHTG